MAALGCIARAIGLAPGAPVFLRSDAACAVLGSMVCGGSGVQLAAAASGQVERIAQAVWEGQGEAASGEVRSARRGLDKLRHPSGANDNSADEGTRDCGTSSRRGGRHRYSSGLAGTAIARCVQLASFVLSAATNRKPLFRSQRPSSSHTMPLHHIPASSKCSQVSALRRLTRRSYIITLQIAPPAGSFPSFLAYLLK